MGRGRRSSKNGVGGDKAINITGCITSFLHIFDFHHHQPSSFLPSSHSIISKTKIFSFHKHTPTVETPRTSTLLIPDDDDEEEEEHNLKIPMSIQIKTSRNRETLESSESNYSPGLKSSNLVARLMGLPEISTPPSSSSSSSQARMSNLNNLRRCQPLQTKPRHSVDSKLTVGTMSLPETPRISSARRSDVDHRFSLQINKENLSRDDLEFNRISFLKKKQLYQDENRSPRQYARKIIKQVKESVVGRKAGLDITNTVVNRNIARNELVNQLNWKKLGTKPSTRHECTAINSSVSLKISSKRQQPPQEKARQKCKKLNKVTQVSNVIRNKQHKSFVSSSTVTKANKTVRRTPLSSDQLPAKKDPSPPATKLPSKQTHRVEIEERKQSSKSCILTQMCIREVKHEHFEEEELVKYVSRILKHSGIEKNTRIQFIKWFSYSHPLDPYIFYCLEHLYEFTPVTTQFSHPYNRRLIFDLIDENLVLILKRYIRMKSWMIAYGHILIPMIGSELIDMLCSIIRGYPVANCRVLDDIDALIDKDMRGDAGVQICVSFEEDKEVISSEIEMDILDNLVLQTTLDFVVGWWN